MFKSKQAQGYKCQSKALPVMPEQAKADDNKGTISKADRLPLGPEDLHRVSQRYDKAHREHVHYTPKA